LGKSPLTEILFITNALEFELNVVGPSLVYKLCFKALLNRDQICEHHLPDTKRGGSNTNYFC